MKKMRNFVETICENVFNPVVGTILAVFLGLFLLNVFCCLSYEEERQPETYALTTVVIDVSRGNDTVTVKDFNGNLWQFHECEDWEEGDICAMVMNDNATDIITDDEIESVRYSGWFEGWQ